MFSRRRRGLAWKCGDFGGPDYPTTAMPPAGAPEPEPEPGPSRKPIIIAVVVAIVIGLGAGALWAARSGDAEPEPSLQPESDGIDDYDTGGHSDDCSDHRGRLPRPHRLADSNPNADADTDEDQDQDPHRQPDDHVATVGEGDTNPPDRLPRRWKAKGDFESNGAP